MIDNALFLKNKNKKLLDEVMLHQSTPKLIKHSL